MVIVTYEIRLKGGEAEVIEGADTYQLEGPLTTFFRTRPGRTVIDCWSRRVASYRTVDIVRIRCHAGAAATGCEGLSGTEGTLTILRDF